MKEDTDAHRGGYFKLVAFRAKHVYELHRHPIYAAWWYDVLAMMLIGMGLLVDLLYAWLDPRLRQAT